MRPNSAGENRSGDGLAALAGVKPNRRATMRSAVTSSLMSTDAFGYNKPSERSNATREAYHSSGNQVLGGDLGVSFAVVLLAIVKRNQNVKRLKPQQPRIR